jgi:hypothetical protein
MPVETKFLRLPSPAVMGQRIDGWRVCWVGGWDKGRVLFVVMVERPRRQHPGRIRRSKLVSLQSKGRRVTDVHDPPESGSRKGRENMMTYTINEENEIVAFATAEEAAAATATPFDSFSSQQEFGELAVSWPAERLVAIWNSLTGVVPVTKFRDSKTAGKRIWGRIERLGENVEP